VVPEQNLIHVPVLRAAQRELSWSEAAAFSLVTLTAWRMLRTRARIEPGETVLIWGVGGGVSSAALAIAKFVGASVFVTSSSDEKLAVARELGADVTLNHETQDIAKEVRALTDKRGVDIVVENVGEATWERSLRLLARGGRLVTCGATTGPKVSLDVRKMFWHQWTLMGSTMGNATEYAEIVRVLSEGELRPVIDSTYPLDRAVDAFHRLAAGEQIGKIVVEIR
jgi:NADPH:quinone reductase-like Zn-dependent oxidoreductase